jgi:hypothetical protein
VDMLHFFEACPIMILLVSIRSAMLETFVINGADVN